MIDFKIGKLYKIKDRHSDTEIDEENWITFHTECDDLYSHMRHTENIIFMMLKKCITCGRYKILLKNKIYHLRIDKWMELVEQ